MFLLILIQNEEFWLKSFEYWWNCIIFQKFRDSNPFGPQSDSGRLTVINSGSLRQQTPSQPRFYID